MAKGDPDPFIYRDYRDGIPAARDEVKRITFVESPGRAFKMEIRFFLVRDFSLRFEMTFPLLHPPTPSTPHRSVISAKNNVLA